MKKINLAVIFGGKSGEHEISVKSAAKVMESLDKKKYDIFPIKINKAGKWKSKKSNFQIEKLKKMDVVLPIMHGPFGEDGKLQGMLDMLGIKYLFSGTLASALAMNKLKTKIIAREAGLSVPDYITLDEKKYSPEEIAKKLKYPIVIKPIELGSSVGMSIVRSKKDLEAGIDDAFKYGNQVLLEKFIKGRELTVAVMGNGKNIKALPVVEIVPKVSGWFDYKAKYEDEGSDEICPAKIPEEIKKRIQKDAVTAFKSIGCKDLARADFIWDTKSDKLYFLEINTIPGMTENSLAPKAAKAAGMEFGEFLDRLISGAI